MTQNNDKEIGDLLSQIFQSQSNVRLGPDYAEFFTGGEWVRVEAQVSGEPRSDKVIVNRRRKSKGTPRKKVTVAWLLLTKKRNPNDIEDILIVRVGGFQEQPIEILNLPLLISRDEVRNAYNSKDYDEGAFQTLTTVNKILYFGFHIDVDSQGWVVSYGEVKQLTTSTQRIKLYKVTENGSEIVYQEVINLDPFSTYWKQYQPLGYGKWMRIDTTKNYISVSESIYTLSLSVLGDDNSLSSVVTYHVDGTDFDWSGDQITLLNRSNVTKTRTNSAGYYYSYQSPLISPSGELSVGPYCQYGYVPPDPPQTPPAIPPPTPGTNYLYRYYVIGMHGWVTNDSDPYVFPMIRATNINDKYDIWNRHQPNVQFYDDNVAFGTDGSLWGLIINNATNFRDYVPTSGVGYVDTTHPIYTTQNLPNPPWISGSLSSGFPQFDPSGQVDPNLQIFVWQDPVTKKLGGPVITYPNTGLTRLTSRQTYFASKTNINYSTRDVFEDQDPSEPTEPSEKSNDQKKLHFQNIYFQQSNISVQNSEIYCFRNNDENVLLRSNIYQKNNPGDPAEIPVYTEQKEFILDKISPSGTIELDHKRVKVWTFEIPPDVPGMAGQYVNETYLDFGYDRNKTQIAVYIS